MILTLVGLFVSYGKTWLTFLGYTISGYAAPLIYLFWMTLNDRYEREPLALVALTFGWGAFCAIFASLLNFFVAVPLLGAPGAAIVEEPLKLMGVYWLANHPKIGSEFNDHLDGMIYGAAAGAGFAGLENLYYIIEMVTSGGSPPIIAIAIRSATSLSHIAWSAIAARSVGLAKALRGRNVVSDVIPGLMLVVPLHFMWNLFSPVITLFFLLPFNLSILFRQIKAAQDDEVRWGFMTKAPVE